jgi:hypothetical protein
LEVLGLDFTDTFQQRKMFSTVVQQFTKLLGDALGGRCNQKTKKKILETHCFCSSIVDTLADEDKFFHQETNEVETKRVAAIQVWHT